MKLATTTGDFFPYTNSQVKSLKFIAEAGFHYADYSFCADARERTGIFGKEPELHILQVRQASEELGIGLVQAHAPMGRPLGEGSAALLEDTIASVEACGQWRIPNLVVHAGYAPGLSIEETLEKNREFFLPILHCAEKYGINILIENFNKMTNPDVYWTDNAPQLLQQIQCVDHPLFHAVWDVGHANLMEMPQNEALRILGGHVRALHIHDNLGDWDAHLLPYLGTTNWDCVMQGLLDIGYDGYFTFEVGQIFRPKENCRPFDKDDRLAAAPLALRRAAEHYLYKLGKCILESYHCFEE